MDKTTRAIKEKNIFWMIDHEEENPEYYGRRIKELSEELGI